MPINVAVHEPRTGVVCTEADCDIIVRACTDVDHVTADWILIIVISASSYTHDVKVMTV